MKARTAPAAPRIQTYIGTSPVPGIAKAVVVPGTAKAVVVSSTSLQVKDQQVRESVSIQTP